MPALLILVLVAFLQASSASGIEGSPSPTATNLHNIPAVSAESPTQTRRMFRFILWGGCAVVGTVLALVFLRLMPKPTAQTLRDLEAKVHAASKLPDRPLSTDTPSEQSRKS